MDDNVKFDFLFLHPQYHNNLTNNGAYDISKYDHKFEHNKMAQYLRKKKKIIILNYQALDSMSSSISRTACSGPLPYIKTLSDGLFRLRGPFPNKQTCGSIWFNRFHSSSERDQLKMSIFLFILSGFKLHGRTLVPLCSPHRNITYNHRLQIIKSTPTYH